MIEAALAGKLDCLDSEDALTAAVFERLRYLPCTVLKRWLDNSVPLKGGLSRVKPWPDQVTSYSFWPSWLDPKGGRVEPDLILEFDGAAVIVEAKLWSGKSDPDRDQLARQWIVGERHFRAQGRGTRLVAHIYLTAHLTFPVQELAESSMALREAGYGDDHLWWLSWATLCPLLAELSEEHAAADLLRYLTEVDVASFLGWRSVRVPLERWKYRIPPRTAYWAGIGGTGSGWLYGAAERRYWTRVELTRPPQRWTYGKGYHDGSE